MKTQNHIGLDIGESTIKIVQLSGEIGKQSLTSIGIAESPIRANTPEADKLTIEAIKKLVNDTGVKGKSVVLSLPESQVYTRVVELPFLEEPELTTTIKWQAEQYIPVSVSDVTLKHQILSMPDTNVPGAKMTVLLVAAPTALVNRYSAIAASAKLEVAAIETEIFAVARALLLNDAFDAYSMIVNFGVDTTTLAIMKKGDLALTQSIPIGGAAVNRALSANLNLDAASSEQYKKSYGLSEGKGDGKVYGAIKSIVDQMVVEVKKVITYGESRQGGGSVKRVILCGGNALIPGLLPYFTANLGLEVQLGNPFTKLSLNDRQKQAVFDAGPLFACSVGLAMKTT